jgi:lysophospholipase L1-like esterase
MPVAFVHSGWGGDRVTGGGGGPIDVRLKRDVLAYQPTVMTVMLGMNDGRYRAFDQQIFDAYANGYRQIVATVKKALPGIRITAIEQSPYDDVTQAPQFPGGYNAVLVKYGQFIKQLSAEEGLTAADLNTGVVAALEKAKAADAALAAKIIPDRVHPGPGGHLLMAAALLRAWRAPAVVAAVEIDTAAKRIVHTENTEVKEFEDGASISWTQIDSALPMPVDGKDAALALAVRSSDFVDTLNREPLKVTGLRAPRYKLTIDDEAIGTFSREQLAEGVNLALLPTPMARQAAEVHGLTLKHNHVHFARWRQLQVPLESDFIPQLRTALDALDEVETAIVMQQRAVAQPRARRYRLAAE